MLLRRDETKGQSGPTTGTEKPHPLFSEMPGRSDYFLWHGARIHYRRAGAGAPVVLVHMVDVGASCVEWRRNTEILAQGCDTWSVDLPGFGLSGMPQEAPRAALYVRFLTDFLNHVRAERGQQKIAAIGSGTGAAYLAAVAESHSHLFSRLLLVCPTGITACKPNPFGAVAFHALRLPGVSAIASGASSHTAILEHLRDDVYGDATRAGTSEADARYWVAHRPHAQAVERARIAGLLNVDLQPVIERVQLPTLLAWGRKASCPPASDAEAWREMNARAIVQVFEQSGLCPHFEEPGRFNELALEFLSMDRLAQAA
jgi:pimeloyl-ACP methyl ester carboxylesterase